MSQTDTKRFVISFMECDGDMFEAYISHNTVPTQAELMEFAKRRYPEYNEIDDTTGTTYTTLRIGSPLLLDDTMFEPLKPNNHE